MTYLLDIFIERGELYQPCAGIVSPIWVQIRADGLERPFNTGRVAPCPYPGWGHGGRLILHLDTLNNKHFKAFLMTVGQGGQEIHFTASQISLQALPMGRPKRFSFPMMLCSNYNVTGGTLYVTATLSSLVRQTDPSTQPVMRQMQWGQSSYPSMFPAAPRSNPLPMPAVHFGTNPVLPQINRPPGQ